MAPDDGVVFTFAELLFPVGAMTTLDGATVTAAILNVANGLTVQLQCRLLCQIKMVAMTTVKTHSATPTAAVTSRWEASTSAVDVSSDVFSWPASLRFDLAISVLTQAQRRIQSQARFPSKRNRLRCVRCVNENRKKRKRLRWQAANHGCHCFDRAFLLAGACVCCVKFSRLNGNRALHILTTFSIYTQYFLSLYQNQRQANGID